MKRARVGAVRGLGPLRGSIEAMTRPLDTSAAAWEIQTRLLRSMTPAQRLEIAQGMTRATQELAFAELRRRHPDAGDDDLWLQLAARRLGVDTIRRVYGRDIELS